MQILLLNMVLMYCIGSKVHVSVIPNPGVLASHTCSGYAIGDFQGQGWCCRLNSFFLKPHPTQVLISSLFSRFAFLK